MVEKRLGLEQVDSKLTGTSHFGAIPREVASAIVQHIRESSKRFVEENLAKPHVAEMLLAGEVVSEKKQLEEEIDRHYRAACNALGLSPKPVENVEFYAVFVRNIETDKDKKQMKITEYYLTGPQCDAALEAAKTIKREDITFSFSKIKRTSKPNPAAH